MSKVSAEVVKQSYERYSTAKLAAFQAHHALEVLPEFIAARKADEELALAEVLLEAVKTLMGPKVV